LGVMRGPGGWRVEKPGGVREKQEGFVLGPNGVCAREEIIWKKVGGCV